MHGLLEEIDFQNPARARDDVARLGNVIPESVWNQVRVLLASLPDPDEALHFFERFHHEAPDAFQRVARSPTALHYLLTTFSYSNFLSEAILRDPQWLFDVLSSGDLYRVLSGEEFELRLEAFLGNDFAQPPPALALARFRRRKMLRILLRDVMGFGTLSDITEELSNLSDALLEFSYRRISEGLARKYGTPRYEDDSGTSRECQFAVLALGKLGGKELNYSSDIDLMFLYSADGATDGADPITNREFFKKVANQLTDLLSTYTQEGQCYRVDLRLRPDGRLGEVAIPLEGAKNYYGKRARDWELQMLIKARVAAGSREAGRELLRFVEPLIYSTTLDFRAVESVSATRERIGEKLASRRPSRSGIDVKLTPGGIRDIEFLVQCLQRLHGGRTPWVRHGGTLMSLFRLRDRGLLSPTEYSRLASAYQFLRNLEHRLQFYQDQQTHLLPADPRSLEILARKMPMGSAGEASAESLARQLRIHLDEVRELYARVIHAQKPMYYSGAAPSNGTEADADSEDPDRQPENHAQPAVTNLIRFLDRKAPGLAAALSRRPLNRGRERFEHFLEKVFALPEWLDRLDRDAALAECTADMFEYSRYYSDQLIRKPDLLEVMCSRGSHEERCREVEAASEVGELRRLYRRQMLRIQSESLCGREPIFTTLEKTSDLADAAISAVYRMSVAQTSQARDGYVPRNPMMVIAIGRLGMREFDLASDADLVFVIRGDEPEERLFWTAVAERIINAIGAYTGEGVMFTVDTRLRPNGREGALVQTESGYKEYFGKHAEAWEGISYMKSRTVAGDVDRGTIFLNELQEVDWRRYGQSGRSRAELREMRARLEREQGARNPLKAGRGGYYDIDFALMYLRLKGAGIFYKVLNTPARIDVIEKMGHLDREDANFLRQAGTFYRAIDHGLRLTSGQAEGQIPTSPSQLEVLSELVRRWTPAGFLGEPEVALPEKLVAMRRQTRDIFERLFGG
ncbi:MAG: glutamine-synthetase adenylyltransferase [Bryobacteraceae bacterium]